MKKIIFTLCLGIMLIFNICEANSYEGNENYVEVTNANQGTYYLNLKTINVIKYKPPQYQIAGSFVHVTLDSEGQEKVRNIYVNLLYDWETKEIFRKDTYGNWEISDTDESSVKGKVNRKIAEALFRAAYKMEFYGD